MRMGVVVGLRVYRYPLLQIKNKKKNNCCQITTWYLTIKQNKRRFFMSRKHISVPRANLGLAFREVCIRLTSGEEVVGFRHEPECTETNISLWVGEEVLPRVYAIEHVQSSSDLPIIEVPPQMYTTVKKSTGGLGKHIRWIISCSQTPPDGEIHPATILVGNFDDAERWELLKNIVQKLNPNLTFAQNKVEYHYCNSQRYASLVASDKMRANHLSYILASHQFVTHFPNPIECREVSMIAERLDRYPHMYVDQCRENAATAGPVRDPWRWKLSWLPVHWDSVFTWPGFAREMWNDITNIGEDPITVLNRFPSPLNYYIWEHILTQHKTELANKKEEQGRMHAEVESTKAACLQLEEELQELEFIAKSAYKHGKLQFTVLGKEVKHVRGTIETLKGRITTIIKDMKVVEVIIHDHEKVLHASGNRSFIWITPAISEEQNVDLLRAAVLYHYSVQEESVMKSLSNRLFRYSQTGFAERHLGMYNRDGEHRGHGRTLRQYQGEAKIGLDNMHEVLPVHIQNRLTVDGDAIWGTGSRAYRGRYPSNDLPVVKKRKRGKDRAIREREMIPDHEKLLEIVGNH